MFIFAHRGASAHAPENTLSAFRLAIEQQADGIEFDVYQHNDEFILIHDRWLHRTTNGIGQIQSLLLEQLNLLDAGNGERIPTLAQALECIGSQVQINIEMKGIDNHDALLAYVYQCCGQFNIPLSNLLFSSFDHQLLSRVKSSNPKLRIGALTASRPLHLALFAEELEAEFVNADVTFVNQEFVDDAHQRGLKMGVYTVDQPEDLLQLQNWGVDAVFCNSPLSAKLILQKGL